jgi:uncharacterized membrane protein YkoI
MMIKKSIVAIVAIIAAVGIVFAAYGGTGNNNPPNSSSNLENQQSSAAITSNTNTNTNTATKKVDTNKIISASKAKEIAQKYIEVATAKAGTPKLIKSGKTMIYVVPVVDNGQVVGEIEISAQTGANVGGAGGAP